MSDGTEPIRVPISKRLVLINSASGIVTRLLTIGVFAWVIQYLIKRVPEDELALLPIVMSVAMVLPLLQSILAGGLSRHVTEAYARNDLAGVTRIVSSQFPLLLAGGLLIFVVGGLVAWNVQHILTIPPDMLGKARFMTFLVVSRLAIGMPLAAFNSGIIARQRFVLQNAIDIVGSLVRLGLMLTLILGVGPEVQWVVLAQVASQLFIQFSQTAVSMRLLPALRFHPHTFHWETCKQVLSFSGWNFVAESASMIRRAADPPILNELSTAVQVNNFYLGSLVETQLRQMAIIATQPLIPALTAMHAHNQTNRLSSAFLRGGRIALWASMFLAVPLIVCSHDLFALYLGSEYPAHVDAATVMIILLLGFPFTYPTTMYFRIAYAMGDMRRIAIRAIAAQLSNLALTIVLVGPLQLGAIGSASATLVAFVIGHPILYWPLALKALQLSWRKFITESLAPGLCPSVIAGVAGWLATQAAGPSIAVRAAVGVSVCLVAYAIALLFVLKPSDRADLGRIRKAVRI